VTQAPRQIGSTVRAATLSNFAEVAQQVGVNARRLLRDVGLDWGVLGDPDLLLPAEAVATLLESAARESGCQTFGLRMAESRRLSDFGAVSLLIAHQPTLRASLQTVVEYRHLINEVLVMQVEEIGGFFHVRVELVLRGSVPRRQPYELALGVMFRMLSAVLGPRWRPNSTRFSHAAPDDLSVHRRVFRSEVLFDCEFNEIICWGEDLDRANPAADPAMAQYARRFVDGLSDPDRRSATFEVRKALYLRLPEGGASIGQVALALGLTVRTLQRRLDAEGAEFSDLLNGVRRELAERHLESASCSVSEVSRLLGYGQLSSFSRWFLAEFGTSPSAWRRELRSARVS
jgi:AraC-like DNA-binding protein